LRRESLRPRRTLFTSVPSAFHGCSPSVMGLREGRSIGRCFLTCLPHTNRAIHINLSFRNDGRDSADFAVARPCACGIVLSAGGRPHARKYLSARVARRPTASFRPKYRESMYYANTYPTARLCAPVIRPNTTVVVSHTSALEQPRLNWNQLRLNNYDCTQHNHG